MVARTAVATLTLVDALAARPALRLQVGEQVWRQVLTIAADPRPEVIELQNSIWLATWTRRVFVLVQREEPSLWGQVERILADIDRYVRSIGRHPIERMRADPCDTWEERRGEV